uniref:NADH dehydrogenase subunit 2 n=1 Tax=Nisia atrovenosa TaxID=1187023 RepID=UPI002A81DC53|nr:NADH dehydrogenase subunit 2 [Nisia atrovenosa]WOW98918.1 NADH dehydrogenase subunit 2 [Nisia atrovenosa]
MKFNNQNFLTLNIMMLSIYMILSSSNWMFSWMMMELGFFSFLIIMSQSMKISYQLMKFFIIQSISSSLMIFFMMMESMNQNYFNLIFLMNSFVFKLGLSPLHFWMPMMFSFMNYYSCLIFSTFQKIGPLIIMSQFISFYFMKPILMLSLMIGSISSIKQNKFKKLLAFISISSMPWMIMSIYMSKNLFIIFFMLYLITNFTMFKLLMENNILSINQLWIKSQKNKILIQLSILSTMGLPPLIGFIPKWMILKNFSSMMGSLSLILVLSSSFQCLSFLKLTINNLFISSISIKSSSKNIYNKSNSLLFFISLIQLPTFSMLMI